MRGKRTKPSPDEVAAAYISQWESLWNTQGGAATAQLYTPDSFLIGAATAIGRPNIERLLTRLFQQGWTKISIKVVAARKVGSVVLAACEFSVVGSGPNAGKKLNGKSSHVLTQFGGVWLSAMHTAT